MAHQSAFRSIGIVKTMVLAIKILGIDFYTFTL